MKLEVGKKYRTRAGEIVVIVESTTGHSQPFLGEFDPPHIDQQRWSPNGQFFLDEGKCDTDLVEEIKEFGVSKKAEKLNKLIDEMPVCNDGKAKIRELVQEITGEKLIKRKPKRGEVWSSNSGKLYIVVDDDQSMRLDGEQTKYGCNFYGGHFVANSVTEYIANGGKL